MLKISCFAMEVEEVQGTLRLPAIGLESNIPVSIISSLKNTKKI